MDRTVTQIMIGETMYSRLTRIVVQYVVVALLAGSSQFLGGCMSYMHAFDMHAFPSRLNKLPESDVVVICRGDHTYRDLTGKNPYSPFIGVRICSVDGHTNNRLVLPVRLTPGEHDLNIVVTVGWGSSYSPHNPYKISSGGNYRLHFKGEAGKTYYMKVAVLDHGDSISTEVTISPMTNQ